MTKLLYCFLVGRILEYSDLACDPYYDIQTDYIKLVQHRFIKLMLCELHFFTKFTFTRTEVENNSIHGHEPWISTVYGMFKD